MKKVLNRVFATVFIFLLSGLITVVYSEEWIEKTVVDKEFEISSDAKLIIDHEFGNVVCENWDKNVISIVATIRVNTSNAEKAASIINNVIVDVKGTRNKVEAICDLNQKFRNSKKYKVVIDFDIKMPSSISLDLESKFGSASIESVDGPTIISSEYGNLGIVSLSNHSNVIDVEFGNADIKYIAEGALEVSYSHLSIKGADNLSLESEYSDVDLGKIGNLSFEIEGGNSNIEYVENLEIESSFSNIEIDELSNSLNSETDYGSMNISYIHKGFSDIYIANSYGAVSLGISENASYKMEADGKYCSITYPEGKATIGYKNVGSGSTIIKGTVGSDAKSGSSVVVSSDYGSINIGSK